MCVKQLQHSLSLSVRVPGVLVWELLSHTEMAPLSPLSSPFTAQQSRGSYHWESYDRHLDPCWGEMSVLGTSRCRTPNNLQTFLASIPIFLSAERRGLACRHSLSGASWHYWAVWGESDSEDHQNPDKYEQNKLTLGVAVKWYLPSSGVWYLNICSS